MVSGSPHSFAVADADAVAVAVAVAVAGSSSVQFLLDGPLLNEKFLLFPQYVTAVTRGCIIENQRETKRKTVAKQFKEGFAEVVVAKERDGETERLCTEGFLFFCWLLVFSDAMNWMN